MFALIFAKVEKGGQCLAAVGKTLEGIARHSLLLFGFWSKFLPSLSKHCQWGILRTVSSILLVFGALLLIPLSSKVLVLQRTSRKELCITCYRCLTQTSHLPIEHKTSSLLSSQSIATKCDGVYVCNKTRKRGVCHVSLANRTSSRTIYPDKWWRSDPQVLRKIRSIEYDRMHLLLVSQRFVFLVVMICVFRDLEAHTMSSPENQIFSHPHFPFFYCQISSLKDWIRIAAPSLLLWSMCYVWKKSEPDKRFTRGYHELGNTQ